MSVYEIALADPTELTRPADRLVRLSAVGDLAFISICEEVEGNPKSTSKVIATMAVSLPALREAVELLSHDRDREAMRVKDAKGAPQSDIGGQRFVVAPL